MRRKQRGGSTRTASGLRPASAFVAIATVLLAVSGKAAHIAFWAGGSQPDPVAERAAPWPAFEIGDRQGRPLAVSVECFDLTASPRALWRAHTPDRIASRLADVLGDVEPAALLKRLLPPPVPGAPPGVVRVAEPRLVRFDAQRAARVDRWIQSGGLLEERAKGRIDGLWLVEVTPGTWTLEWDPVALLSEAARARHLGPRSVHRPELWTRHLLTDLAALLEGAPLPLDLESALARLDGPSRRGALRDAIWAELCPTSFRVVRHQLDPVRAHAVDELCREEAVSPWQLSLRPGLERRHPVRPRETRAVAEQPSLEADEGREPVEPEAARRDDAFAVLGHWGVLGPEDAQARARAERDESPAELRWWAEADPVAERAWELMTEWRPWSGLELACAAELARPRWRERLEAGARTYARRLRQVARDRRRRWEGRVPNYFETAEDAPAVPRVVSTLDGELQVALHAELTDLLERHRAALAEGIVLDVESGDVLAVDGVCAYPISGFAPVRHPFTPGSTMKAIIMAIALDQGLVRPEEAFATHAPDGIVLEEGHSRRAIREAEGAPDEAWVSAARGLAESVNAVLVQIGTRIPAPVLRTKLLELGYARRPQAGLGPEVVGHVPALKDGTWRRLWEHASVSFGHELSVTLWQHAAAMATVARGGVYRPLRLIRAVEQGEQRWEIPVEPGSRVLSEAACAEVRAMMALGAREGTGERVASPEQCPELAWIGTKTGTTEKVENEVSLHVEWPRQLELADAGRPWTRAEHAALRGQRDNLGIRRTCYTSSMCAVGRLPGEEREVLVLLVVDEPRSKAKFGADVAGAGAVRVLRMALGLPPTVDAAPPADRVLEEALEGARGVEAFSSTDLPWAEEPAGPSSGAGEGRR